MKRLANWLRKNPVLGTPDDPLGDEIRASLKRLHEAIEAQKRALERYEAACREYSKREAK